MDVVCTAGHVDHGKSTLVRALTGMEPDRFAEERRRGLTIDIGFGWTQMQAGGVGRTVAFVDLPGHERFVTNMLAGAGPAEAALFVVAADAGWNRQSSEHRDILDLLDIRCGVVALTKADTVDSGRLAAVRADIEDRLAGSSLAGAPVVVVSAVTGQGLDDLRGELVGALAHRSVPPDGGVARLWVDRAFSIAGAGTVVTGTLGGGALRVGDEVVVAPAGPTARVRGLQSLKAAVDAAAPGDRVAVNLSGIDRTEVRRGDVVAHLPAPPPATVADVWLRTLPGERVGRRGAWHLHAGSGEWVVKIQPLSGPAVEGEGYARLLLQDPAPLAIGDRVVLREAGRRTTVGGGRILDAVPERLRGTGRRGARVEQLQQRRDALQGGDTVTLLRLHVAERGACSRIGAAAALGLKHDDVASRAGLLRLGNAWADPRMAATWSGAVNEALARHHAQNPMHRGARRSVALQAATAAGCPPALAADLLQVLVATGRITAEGAELRLPGHAVRLSSEQQRAAHALVGALDATPFAPPKLADAAAAAGVGGALVKELEATGVLVRLGPELVMSAAAVAQAASLLRERYVAEGPFTAAQAKELLGTSRKFALPLLEELDRRGITRRSGDVRHVR